MLRLHSFSVACWGFLLVGGATTMLGLLLPALSRQWGLGAGEAGRFFVAQFSGSLLGALCSGRLLCRLGWRALGAAAYTLLAAGVLALGARSYVVALTATAAYGIALGLLIPATNLFVGLGCGGRRAAALNLLNLAWCGGAVATPLVVAASVTQAGITTFAKVFALAAMGMALAVGISTSAGTPKLAGAPGAATGKDHYPPGALTALAALFQFLYVGTENSLSGWLPSFVGRLGYTFQEAAAAQLGLWAAVLAGRMAAPVVLARLDARRWMVASLILALGGTVFVLSVRDWFALLAAVAVSGFGLAAVFPTSVALYLERGRDRVVPAAGLVFACGALGGATIPWVVGLLADWQRDLRRALVVAACCVAAMLLIEVALQRPERRLRGSKAPASAGPDG
jgi:fucose permease